MHILNSFSHKWHRLHTAGRSCEWTVSVTENCVCWMVSVCVCVCVGWWVFVFVLDGECLWLCWMVSLCVCVGWWVCLWLCCMVTVFVLDGECLCLCWMVSVCVCVGCWVCLCLNFTGLNTRNTVIDQGLREIFGLKTEGVAGGEENCTVWSCMVCIGEWMLVGSKLRDSGTDGTREINSRN
jgi:hypothetical protein